MRIRTMFLAALAAFFTSSVFAEDPKPVGKVLIQSVTSVTTTGPGFSSDGRSQRITAHGITTATVTVYGTNVYCGKTCTSSSIGATFVGELTTDGASLDDSTYLYYFALVTSYTSGTISAVTNSIDVATTSNTELPAAVDLETAIDSPVGPYVGSLLYSYDGTDWDPIQQDVQDLDSGAGTDNVAGGFVATPASGGEQVVPSGQASVAVNISTATTTQIVALAASQKIYITGGVLVSSGANTVTLKYGTGAACGTGTTSISGAMDFTAQTGIGFNSGFGPSLVIPSAQAFCITTSAAVQLSGWITYAQY